MSATKRHFRECLAAAKPVIERRLAEVQAQKASGSFVGIHVPIPWKDQDVVAFTDALLLERCSAMGYRGESRKWQPH